MGLVEDFHELRALRHEITFQDKARAILSLLLLGKGREIYQDYKWEQKKEKEEF